jgi:hypothetical protein
MSEPGRETETNREPVDLRSEDDSQSQGPSLTVIYSLIALALVAALFFAAMIVLPFYRGRH